VDHEVLEDEPFVWAEQRVAGATWWSAGRVWSPGLRGASGEPDPHVEV